MLLRSFYSTNYHKKNYARFYVFINKLRYVHGLREEEKIHTPTANHKIIFLRSFAFFPFGFDLPIKLKNHIIHKPHKENEHIQLVNSVFQTIPVNQKRAHTHTREKRTD